jgi:hypothetical protein
MAVGADGNEGDDGDRVFVTSEGRNTNGRRFRNTEILTIRNELIVDIEVYFGWSLPHKAQRSRAEVASAFACDKS